MIKKKKLKEISKITELFNTIDAFKRFESKKDEDTFIDRSLDDIRRILDEKCTKDS